MIQIQKLFLTGPSGTGKSTLLLGMLEAYRERLGGFYVQRHQSAGRCFAYALSAAREGNFQTDVPWRGDTPNAFITVQHGKHMLDLSVFDACGEEMLRQSADTTVMLLDEIGGVELLSDSFFNRLCALLESDVPCIGVCKSDQALILMQREVQEATACGKRRDSLFSLLAGSPSTLLIDNSKTKAFFAVQAFVEERFSGIDAGCLL
jgi:nucleoside-triphosphatase